MYRKIISKINATVLFTGIKLLERPVRTGIKVIVMNVHMRKNDLTKRECYI